MSDKVPDEFLIDIESIQLKDVIVDNEHVKIFRGVQENQKQQVLIHTFPINAFSSSDLSTFFSLIFLFRNDVSSSFIKTLGIFFDQTNVYVVYEDDNYRQVRIENLDTCEKKLDVFYSSIKVLKILDSYKFSFFNLKLSSIFYDSNNHLKFGFFMPYPNITIIPENHKLLNIREKFDVFMLGVLAVQLFTEFDTQTRVLDAFWEFEIGLEQRMEESEFKKELEITDRCLKISPKDRLTIDELYYYLVQKFRNNNNNHNDNSIYQNNDLNNGNYNLNHKDNNINQEITNIFDETTNSNNETNLFFNRYELLTKDEIIRSFIKFTRRNPFFNVLLGSHYLEIRDTVNAMRYFQITPSSPISMNNISLILSSSDPKRSFEILKSAADLGYAVAQKNLAIFYSKGVGISEKDEENYIKYLKLAADQGHAESIRLLVQVLRKRRDVAYRPYVLEGSYRGDVLCLIFLYLALDEGFFLAENERGARIIAEATASMESPVMLNMMSDWFASENNHKKSFELAMKNAASGSREAQLKIALKYLNGNGTQKNEKEAAMWMKKASDQNLAEAMFNYAAMLKNGIGVEKNELEANALCQLASRQRQTNLLLHMKTENIEGEFHSAIPYNYFVHSESD